MKNKSERTIATVTPSGGLGPKAGLEGGVVVGEFGYTVTDTFETIGLTVLV